MTVAPARRPWLGLVLLFMASLPAVTLRIYASDEIEYFAHLRSFWFDRDLSFDNEYRYFYDRGIAASPGFHETFLKLTTDTGRRINFAPIGSAVLWSPFYAVADAAVLVARSLGRPVTRDGFGSPYISAVSYASAVYGFLAVLLSSAAARHVTGRGTAAAVAVWIGTPLLFYMYVTPPWSHAPSAFAVSAFVLVWLKVRQRWSPWGFAALGALAALMTMVREQDAFYVLGPALDFVWEVLCPPRAVGAVREPPLPRWRTTLIGLSMGVIAFALVYLPQAASYIVLNGRFSPSPLVTRKMDWSAPHALGVLLSGEHGLLFWTPLAVLSIVGLLMLAACGRNLSPAGVVRPARRPALPTGDAVGGRNLSGAGLRAGDLTRVAVCCLVMVAGQVYIAGSVDSWSVAGAFGQRRFVSLTPILTIGLAGVVVLARETRGRWVARAAIALAIWWNLGLMAQYGTRMMDRQRLEVGRNAYNTFVVLPRALPGLAYRYIFDRASFYQPSPWNRQ